MDQNIVQSFIKIGQIHTPSGRHIKLCRHIDRLINTKCFQKNGTIFLIMSVLRRRAHKRCFLVISSLFPADLLMIFLGNWRKWNNNLNTPVGKYCGSCHRISPPHSLIFRIWRTEGKIKSHFNCGFIYCMDKVW